MKTCLRLNLLFIGLFFVVLHAVPAAGQNSYPTYQGNFERKKQAERTRHDNRVREIDGEHEKRIRQLAAEIKKCGDTECQAAVEKEMVKAHDERRRLQEEESEKHFKILSELEQGRDSEDKDYNFELEVLEKQQRDGLGGGLKDGRNVPVRLFPQVPGPGTVRPSSPYRGTAAYPYPLPQPAPNTPGFLRTDVWVGRGDIEFDRASDGSHWPLDYEVTLRDYVYNNRTETAAKNGGTSVNNKKARNNNPIVTRIQGRRTSQQTLAVEVVWIKPFGNMTPESAEVPVRVRGTVNLTLLNNSRY